MISMAGEGTGPWTAEESILPGWTAGAARPPRRAPDSRLTGYLARQLTRVGALCLRLRFPAGAELGFRAATWLHADPAWYVRLGEIREARDRWDQAEAAFTAALRLRPDKAAWHAGRGEVQRRRADPIAAAESYQQASRLAPDRREWRIASVRAYLDAGRPDRAIEAGAAFGTTTPPDDPPLADALLVAYEAVGDWPAAAGLLRARLARRPRDLAVRLRLVDCLERLYLVPFTVDYQGAVTATAGDQRSGWLDEAIDQLRQVCAQASGKSGPPHRLGLLYERSGQYAAAADAYRQAMERMATIDSWWCHRAAHEWGFRLAYVEHRLAGGKPSERRLGRSVAPAGGAASERPAGFFDAVMFRHGLQLSGFLLPGRGKAIELHLDDQLLRRVDVQPASWRPVLRYDLTQGLLADFPQRARLTVRAGGQPLVTVDGAEALEIRVPGGTGKVRGKLAGGLSPTKKGCWPRTGTDLATRQEQYLQVYERTRALLDEQDRQLFLCYGTLLGCHREGRFIPGDDDFDVSYASHAANPKQFRRECQRVALALLRQGLDVNLSINGRLFKVGIDGVWIDVTPMWFYQGRAWAFDAHDLTAGAFTPVQDAEFLGRRVYLPRDPEAFLADTYGPDWRTPQPGFRYYRSKADDRILSQMWAKPSEVRELARLAEAERAGNPAAGRFVGVGYPGYPGFSWLTEPDGPRLPAGLRSPGTTGR
jgi:tetratricopeptide (TPR) repeat protein